MPPLPQGTVKEPPVRVNAYRSAAAGNKKFPMVSDPAKVGVMEDEVLKVPTSVFPDGRILFVQFVRVR